MWVANRTSLQFPVYLGRIELRLLFGDMSGEGVDELQ